MKTYIVTTIKGVNIETIKTDVTKDTSIDASVDPLLIPTRSIDIGILPITASTRNTTFVMTKEEARILRNNTDIEAVQLLDTSSEDFVTGSLYYAPDARIPGYWHAQEFLAGSSSICYIQTESINAAKIWMAGNHNLGSPPLAGLTGSLHDELYLFPQYYGETLNGEGVDLIIVDQVMDLYHQEFLRDPNVAIQTIKDPENNSRVNWIDWFDYTNTPGTDPIYHNFLSTGTHGTQCASIAGGNVYGWAPKTEVYFIKASSGGQTNSAYSIYDVFPLIKKFHEQKPIDPNTGFKRPTVVTISITNIHRPYQGFKDSTDGLTHIDQFYPTGSSFGLTGNNNTASLELGFTDFDVTKDPYTNPNALIHNKWMPSINADADECAELGVIICSAAGNRSMPQAGSGSADDLFFEENYYSPYWDSYYTYDEDNSRYEAGEPVYYHRSGFPGGNSIVKCANVSFNFGRETSFDKPPDRDEPQVLVQFGLIPSSERGPRIDIGAISHVNCADASWSTSRYGNTIISSSKYLIYPDSGIYNFNKKNTSNTYNGGTSFAAPQIAGIACLWAQLNPGGNVVGFKKFLKENANIHSIKNPNYFDLSDENGKKYYLRNQISTATGVDIIPTAHYRKSDDPIKLANWPYSSSIQATFSNGIKISKS